LSSKRWSALEQSLDAAGARHPLDRPNAARDQVVARAKELMDKELLTLRDIARIRDRLRSVEAD